ncbi:alpha/beta fold hydrolase [Sandaracinobacteroides saxicola]|uniref:Alpha/beta fold hydrolase n=1 Tax=Sandaracinobacteroides saxicola TaxID=2759707 RepID=A0A7G5IFQ5_9SPHN|nr:alpha/beta fold hydrolase [Sandaracinobacteroides saxicola]QMW22197.1 alpha/beta fold hydrolase [Sandaracinobacteroides saxicola]
MAKKADSAKGVELQGEASVALNPLVGLAREDFLGTVGMMLRTTMTQPGVTLKVASDFASEVGNILTNQSELRPDAKDKRFGDPAWQQNPLYKWSMQYYLAAERGVKQWLDAVEMDELERTRVRFIAGMIVDSLAPTNTLIGNPSAIKKAMETGGQSLLRGLQNAYVDLTQNDGIVSQVDKRPFKVGENLATTPGSVILREPIMELIQYHPATEKVHEIPLLIIPPQINKAYINDLTPEKSMMRFQVMNGMQTFLISWRNPTIEHRDWGLETYVDAIIQAIDTVCAVTGSDKVNVSGACSGGITTATLLSKLAARGDTRVNSATFMVCVLNPKNDDSDAGALVSEHGLALARKRSAEKGILEGSSLARTFAWLRPNDLVWNYVVNNYLHGEDPPAFDILFWNNDATNLTGALHGDYLSLYETQPFEHQGEVTVAGHKLDGRNVTCDLFILGGVTDHITPWKACYRTTQLFGSKNVEFILSQSGHIQAILNPPGNPKAKYYRADGFPPPTPDAWLKTAKEVAGSWWPLWIEWLKARAGAEKPAPKTIGNKAFKPVGPAPGEYVFG